MREFFGIGGYERTPEGAYSWQHLTFVSFLIISMFVGSILAGLLLRKSELKVKNRVLGLVQFHKLQVWLVGLLELQLV